MKRIKARNDEGEREVDCFVANAPRNDEGEREVDCFVAMLLAMTGVREVDCFVAKAPRNDEGERGNGEGICESKN